ncbi:hypothetical protein l11_01460 [Neisseria weaveri LMG 5135]|nr:hypothetical protein l13_11510 [Neisseria weaveri ATCC 51223]EGV38699.1 hypothetical protein l11_01460 [Neisseria weaveri LMG 5135]
MYIAAVGLKESSLCWWRTKKSVADCAGKHGKSAVARSGGSGQGRFGRAFGKIAEYKEKT